MAITLVKNHLLYILYLDSLAMAFQFPPKSLYSFIIILSSHFFVQLFIYTQVFVCLCFIMTLYDLCLNIAMLVDVIACATGVYIVLLEAHDNIQY